MQDSPSPNKAYLAALKAIAEEISMLRKALKPEKQQQSPEEQAEEVRRLQRNIFGD